MKKILTVACLLTTNLCVQAQQEFELNLKLKKTEGAKIVLAYSKENKLVMDTSAVEKDGIYTFKGQVDEPLLAHIVIRKVGLSIVSAKSSIPSPGLQLILTNDKISVQGDANAIYMATVKGGQPNEDWNKIKAKDALLTQQNWLAMKDAYARPTDTLAMKAVKALRSKNGDASSALEDDFINKYPGSFMSLYFLSHKINSLSVEQLEKAYARLGEKYKKTAPAKQIAGKIVSLKATAIGKTAVNFQKKDINGQPVNLETLKGKYVLLDFWGSWCGPCRQGHPHLKELYAKYKDKGFEIVGIAHEQGSNLEQNRQSWKKAIEVDGINWIQVLNNEDMELFDAVKSYGVSAFPTKVLLDKEGKIIGRYVGDNKEFDEKLKTLF